MDARSDNDYWDWREQNERDIAAQAEEQAFYGAMHETLADASVMQAAIASALSLPLSHIRAQRTTEVL